MNYVGTWILHSIGTFGEDGMEYVTPEEYLNAPMPYIDENDPEAVEDEKRERREMMNMRLRICEDGNLYMVLPIPEGVSSEEVEEAVNAGEISLFEGMICQGALPWEERNGEFWFDSGMEGDFCGEATDTWVNPIDENGLFTFVNMRFVKVEE